MSGREKQNKGEPDSDTIFQDGQGRESQSSELLRKNILDKTIKALILPCA